MIPRWHGTKLLVGAAVAATLVLSATSASAAPGDGSAYAARATLSGPLGVPTVNLGPIAPADADGPTTGSLASLPANTLLSAGLATTSAVRDDSTGVVQSQATIKDVGLTLGALGLSAGSLDATCTATQSGNTGTSTFGSLVVLGETLAANPAPNTVRSVSVPGPLGPITIGSITLNEQTTNPDGSLTVNALHLRVLPGSIIGTLVGQGDVVFSSATCGPAAPPIPLASGLGLWLGLGGLVVVAVLARRRLTTR
ncbi:choice-of-anchor P family protein [Actinosynnema sp. NPDC020468]|uniref:choice-of-anchor P family protein n=1 Tax=Actinosynnema sp. NPDC020468 TaxID=3154488 RepID=UPI0033D23FEC